MSFYMAHASAGWVQLATDAASYLTDGTIVAFTRKVHVVDGHSVAIAARGDTALTPRWVDKVDALVKRAGFDVAMAMLGDSLPHLREECAGLDVELCIAGVGAAGPAIYSFRMREETGVAIEPFRLYRSDTTVLCGEDASAWHQPIIDSRRFDLFVVEVANMARRKQASGAADGQRHASVGGHLDITTIDARSVTIDTVHQWPEDRVDEIIDPYRGTNVSRLGASASFAANRQQRRAAERETKKRRA
jgi:hypothetical protein